jgi:hypothetical protein
MGSGGPITDGIYDITQATVYGGAAAMPGPSGASYQGSIRIGSGAFERHVIYKSPGGAVAETLARGTLSVDGGTGVITLTCPFPAQEHITYTASGNGLVISNIVTKDSLGFTMKP